MSSRFTTNNPPPLPTPRPARTNRKHLFTISDLFLLLHWLRLDTKQLNSRIIILNRYFTQADDKDVVNNLLLKHSALKLFLFDGCVQFLLQTSYFLVPEKLLAKLCSSFFELKSWLFEQRSPASAKPSFMSCPKMQRTEKKNFPKSFISNQNCDYLFESQPPLDFTVHRWLFFFWIFANYLLTWKEKLNRKRLDIELFIKNYIYTTTQARAVLIEQHNSIL